MSWNQAYDPLGHWLWSSLLAALPVFVLLGSLAFLKMARAHAALEGRDYVVPDDVKRYAVPILSHRLILQPEHWMIHRVAEDIVASALAHVPVPVLD